MASLKITALIITRNEEKNLPRVLRSVAFCDEILILDTQSTDRTVEIAQAHGARVVDQPWLGYGPQKRRGVELAKNDWVLCLDADEELSPDLSKEVQALQVTPNKDPSAYELRSVNFFLGRPIGKWGRASIWVTKLFDRRFANFGEVKVHEKVLVNEGRLAQLQGKLFHYSYRDLDHYLSKFNKYTTLGAQSLLPEGRRVSVLGLLLRGPLKFFHLYIIQGYFVCGWPGFVWSWLSAGYGIVKLMKLRELQHSPTL